MKNEEEELSRGERWTIRAVKAAGWIFMAFVTWKVGAVIWTIFCNVDFNATLRP